MRLIISIMLLIMMVVLVWVGHSDGNDSLIKWSIGIISPLGTLIMLTWIRDFVREDIDEYNRTDKGGRAISGLWTLIVLQDIFLIMKVFGSLEWSWPYIFLPLISTVIIVVAKVIWMNPPEGGWFKKKTSDWGM
ncbi:MAG: hypothetical protein Q7S53_02510 [bacterium]|nr:hypothetical protein [bacterium]